MALDKILVEFQVEQEKLRQEIESVRGEFKKVGKQVAETSAESNKQLGSISNTLKTIGATVGIAFGLDAVKNFAIASVRAFADAEKQALVLKNAMKGNEAAFQRLGQQAEKLSGQLGIDDDTFTQMQAFLAQQGLTEKQIIATTEAAAKLSSVTGQDLQTAVMTLSGTFEGNIGRLGKLDSGFKDLTQTQLENGGAIELVNNKYSTILDTMEQTTATRIGRLEVWWGNLKEGIGETIVKLWDFINGTNQTEQSPFIKKWTAVANEIKSKEIPNNLKEINSFIKKQQEELTTLNTLREKYRINGVIVQNDETDALSFQINAYEDLIKSANKKIEVTKKQAILAEEERKKSPEYIAQVKAKEEAEKKRKDNLESILKTVKGINDEFEKGIGKGKQTSLWDDIFGGLEGKDGIKDISENLPKIAQATIDISNTPPPTFREWIESNADAIVKSTELMKTALSAVGEIASNIYQQQIEDAQHSQEEQLKALEKRNQEGTLSDRAYALQKERIEKEGAKKNFEIRLKQAKLERELALFNIALSLAQALVKDTLLPPGEDIAQMAFDTATAAIQTAVVLSKPLPKYHTGKKAEINNSLEQYAIIRRDEDVIAPDKSRIFRPELDAIHKGRKDYERLILNKYVMPAIKKDRASIFNGSMAQNMVDSINLLGGLDNIENAVRRNKEVSLSKQTIKALASSMATDKDIRNGWR